jgi:MoaA/NifB/PqqE/SkfB family radical SAM enzyme
MMLKKINIHSVRAGFATNSSSSHSIIFLPGGAADDDVDGNFGWDYFTAGSQEAKLRYLAITVNDGMRRFTTKEIAALVTKEWLGVGGFDKVDKWGGVEAGYIDHQSMLSLPSTWDEKALHKGFVEAFRDFLLQDEVVILGGNDNDEHEHHLLELGTRACSAIPQEGPAGMVTRWDEKYKFWTLFNRNSGTKTRMSFDNNGEETKKVTRASTPELVDLKITDYCPMGCEFCYQDSTPEGEHAREYHLQGVVSSLRDLKVFEVAIGGGEPTLHPKFLEIMEMIRQRKIVPNFTTKRLDWLRKAEFRERALSACGAFAYSATSAKEARESIQFLDEYNVDNWKFNIQLVLGVVPEPEVEEIMNLCGENGIRLTLLGYKTTGRGDKFPPLQYRDWLNAALRTREKHPWRFQLGVDTVLAARFDEQLREMGIDDRFYETKEGRFSMYIDAVKGVAGPSSFCASEDMKPIDLKNTWRLAEPLAELFQGFE